MKPLTMTNNAPEKEHHRDFSENTSDKSLKCLVDERYRHKLSKTKINIGPLPDETQQ